MQVEPSTPALWRQNLVSRKVKRLLIANLYRRTGDRNYYDRLGAPLGLGLPAGAPLRVGSVPVLRRLPPHARAASSPSLADHAFSARRRAGRDWRDAPLGVTTRSTFWRRRSPTRAGARWPAKHLSRAARRRRPPCRPSAPNASQVVRRYVELEIKHGRISMLACTGIFVTEAGFRWPGYLSKSLDLKFEDVPGGALDSYAAVPALGWLQIVAFIIILELGYGATPRVTRPATSAARPGSATTTPRWAAAASPAAPRRACHPQQHTEADFPAPPRPSLPAPPAPPSSTHAPPRAVRRARAPACARPPCARVAPRPARGATPAPPPALPAATRPGPAPRGQEVQAECGAQQRPRGHDGHHRDDDPQPRGRRLAVRCDPRPAIRPCEVASERIAGRGQVPNCAVGLPHDAAPEGGETLE